MDDLIKRLEQYSKPGRGDDHPQAVACREAKDRIEQLERERDATLGLLGAAADNLRSLHRAETAEAKLAKAVAMFKAIEMWDAARGYPMPYRVRDPMRAVLAELEALREIATIRGVRT